VRHKSRRRRPGGRPLRAHVAVLASRSSCARTAITVRGQRNCLQGLFKLRIRAFTALGDETLYARLQDWQGNRAQLKYRIVERTQVEARA
jgi:hypothetical protein